MNKIEQQLLIKKETVGITFAKAIALSNRIKEEVFPNITPEQIELESCVKIGRHKISHTSRIYNSTWIDLFVLNEEEFQGTDKVYVPTDDEIEEFFKDLKNYL